MGVRKYKPTSAGTRFRVVSDFADVTVKKPHRPLVGPMRKSGGRNNLGRITCRHRGGGHRRAYRKIDFQRLKDGIPGRVESIEYDPNRSCRIALILYADGERRYILAPKDIQVGESIESGAEAEPKRGNAMPLSKMPLGSLVHNVELRPGEGGKLVRAAGTFAQLMAREGGHALLRMPSEEIRKVPVECRATLGQLSNIEHNLLVSGKAGRTRWKGIRPTVRGTAMNPVAHPMGGGEGRRGGGRHPCSKWGKLAKGGRTRSKRKPSSKFILRPRKRGRFQRT